MSPIVNIIMDSKSDYKVLEAVTRFLDKNEVPFEMHVLSTLRTPEEVKQFASSEKKHEEKMLTFKSVLKKKVITANVELAQGKFKFWV